MRTKGEKFLSRQFARYRKGQLDENSRQVIDDWFDEKRNKQDEVPSSSTTAEHEMGELLFANIQQAINVQKKPARLFWLKIAAVLVITGITAVTYHFMANTDISKATMARVYTTSDASQKQISLPDGSVIRMNAATVINIPQDFGKDGTRSVILEKGEAFFDIKRDTSRPFVINSGVYRTTVLGTSFIIRLYPQEKRYLLAVASGKVKVEHKSAKGYALLSPGLTKGKTLTFDEEQEQVKLSDRGAEVYLGWVSGRSEYLSELNLIQIGAALERRYGVKVQVLHPPGKLSRYSLELNQPDIKSALRMLAIKTGMQYELNQQTLTIRTGQ